MNNLKNNMTDNNDITVVCKQSEYSCILDKLTVIIEQLQLPLQCQWQVVDKINNKSLRTLTTNQSVLIAELDKQGCLICNIYYQAKEVEHNTEELTESNSVNELNTYHKKNNLKAEKLSQQAMKVSLDWHKLQRRVVTAGRKSELLLQACKLNADSRVIDATAGFGHDSLILASTLSNSLVSDNHEKVIMVEQNPIMVLLLVLEKQRMQIEKNWQGLMARLDIRFGNVLNIRHQFYAAATIVDVVYLDPMFPNNSYEGAKVGKSMQVLHELAEPPTLEEESALLLTARSLINKNGRVVVKRPKDAPYLAHITPNESWENDAVRFDGYFGSVL